MGIDAVVEELVNFLLARIVALHWAVKPTEEEIEQLRKAVYAAVKKGCKKVSVLFSSDKELEIELEW